MSAKNRSELPETDIAIIGAGIAGLYCGYCIEKLPEPKKKGKDFRIFEESDHLGGRIWSTRILRGIRADAN